MAVVMHQLALVAVIRGPYNDHGFVVWRFLVSEPHI